jgi:hypothetical protein
MNGFMFTTIVVIASCQVDKKIILNNLGLRVVPNSSFSSGWSLLPLSLIVFIDFMSIYRLWIWSHLFSVT